MKKIFLIFILLFAFKANALALEESEWSDYTPNYKEANDKYDVKTEKRYKYFKYVKEYGDYGSPSDEYPYLDKSDSITVDDTALYKERPPEIEGKTITYKRYFHYILLNPTVKAVIKADGGINCESVKFFTRLDGGFDGDPIEYTADKDISKLKDGETATIYFNYNRNIYNMLIHFNLPEEKSYGFGKFELSFYDKDDHLLKKMTEFVNRGKHDYSTTDYFLLHRVSYYSDVDYKRSEGISGFMECEWLYRYNETLYRTYKLKKEYYDEYLTEPYLDYTNRDDSDYKDFYSYRPSLIKPILKENNQNINAPDVITTKIEKQPIINKNYTSKYEGFGLENSSNNPSATTLTQAKEDNYKIPLKTEKKDLKKASKNILDYIWFIILVIILVLVLSKVYKKHKKSATV